jgi:internalin A
MAVVLILGGGLGWLAHRARVQRQAVEVIRRAGGSVEYNTPWYRGPSPLPSAPSPGPIWMRRALGPDYFDSVTSVRFSEARTEPKTGGDAVMRAASRLPRLESLSIVQTDATDAGAQGLGALTSLRSLDIRLNHMTALAVRDLGRLSELRELRLASIPLSDGDMGFLKSLTRLEHLQLPGRASTLTDAWLENVAGLTNLKALELYDMPITSAGLRHLRGLTSLGVLNLHDARVDNLESIRPLVKLGSLGLYGNPIRDDDLEVLKALPGLYSLDLRRTGITDDGVIRLLALPSLKDLRLDGTAITDAGLIDLARLPMLRSISIRDTRITAGAVSAFVQAHPAIKVGR